MKTDSLSEGGKEKECALREREKESVVHSTEIERIPVLWEKWKTYLLPAEVGPA